jgi:hypothetical protein
MADDRTDELTWQPVEKLAGRFGGPTMWGKPERPRPFNHDGRFLF